MLHIRGERLDTQEEKVVVTPRRVDYHGRL
jgi:hypothetical protein